MIGLLGTMLPARAWAQGVLSLEVVNGYNLVVDSNVTAPSTYAPSSAYIGAEICNTGTASLDNVVAHVGDYNGGSGDTPGVFPSWSSAGDPRAFIADTGSYSLTLEAGSTGIADGARYIGTLEAGECSMEYWLFSYPQCVNVDGQPQSPPCDVGITGGVAPTDDVSLDYDIWATTTTGGVATASETHSFTMRNEISAAANKIWPNTAAKVPDEYLAAIESVIGWGTLGPDGQPLSASSTVYPGERLITTQGIWYDLGNVGQGFDNDGDLVPDQNAWLQPVGDPGSFDADCFRMVNVYGVVIVKLKTGGELLIPFQNQLYFEHIPDNTGVVGLVYYQFVATDGGCSANMTPYQEAASGFDNEKFSADYGLALALTSGSYGTDLSFTKTDGTTSTSTGSTLTYTVAVPTNNTGVHLGAPDLGTPLVFRESIPPGTTFVAGSADDSPSTNLVEPTGTGSYTQGYTDRDGDLDSCTINYSITSSSFVLQYSSDDGNTWTFSEPGTVTDIRWLLETTVALDGSHDGVDCVAPDGSYDDGTLETSLPAGKTVSVSFQVTVDATVGPIVCNTAGLGFGPAASGMEAEDCTLITGSNSLSGTVFEDDGGTGGIYGNGAIDDATEVGIGAGVVVTLYYDRNGDGRADSGDVVYGSTTTAADGSYSFSGLPDGPYVVVVKKYDGATSDGVTNAVNDFLASRCSPVGECDDTAGWGNTTYDPNLPLTTDQGILKRNEDLTTVSLAVNIDLNKDDAAAQAVTDVDFAFAPPFRLTKSVVGNVDADSNGVADTPVDEGEPLSYTIVLENRLPSVGRQGPTGCEYTVWAPAGVNGTPANKAFTNPGNAWDAASPNGTYATAEVTGGGLRFIYGTGFVLPDQPGSITRVEGLYFGYFGALLTDDYLNVIARLGAGTTTATIDTAKIDSYVGIPSDLDPNSAISWDITGLRPGGGTWSWADDFSTVQLEVNPSKASAADQKTFYLDAIGLRVTTDQACAANTSTTLSPVPLRDTYDTTSFAFVSADPAPTSVNTSTGQIEWTDVGPILPGSAATVTVTVLPLDVNGLRSGSCPASLPLAANSACNWAETAYSTYNVKYADGRLANDDADSIAVNIQGKAELRGTVWRDANNDGWPNDDGEAGLPGVVVTLFACVQTSGALETGTSSSKDCASITGGNVWQSLGTTVTDSAGQYQFIGLDTGYYIVEVGDSDGAPATGNAAPFGMTQTAEANDAQDSTGGVANGHSCPTCNNTWGNPAAILTSDQANINLLSAATEEAVAGIDFGYYSATAMLYGNVWYDIDGDATTDPGEDGLEGFTVTLSGTSSATTTTDASGNYSFSGLAAGSYVITVTPPTLRSKAWIETHETTGGTTDLNNQIPVTLAAGEMSGSHDFGYTLADTSSIGDTVYFDFNGNGSQDATEVGIPNVTVWLYQDVDRDGTVDAGVDDLLATDETDTSGNYLFESLAAGSYVVVVDTSDPDFPSGTTATGDPDVNTARIGDLVYLDANGNGSYDTGEDGIAGVVMLLYSNTDGDNTIDAGEPLVAATVTDVDGGYLFTGLSAGNYLVDIDTTTLPDGLSQTSAAFTNVALTTNGSSNTSQDAGYSPSTDYALGNRIWHDVDGDNVQDAGEMGLAGVTVTVTRTTAGPCFSPACTTTTDAAGFWMVTGLTNGDYTVAVSGLPRDFTATAVLPNQTIASADNMNADRGYRYTGSGTSPTGTISGRVFEDQDGDLAYDVGEARSGTTVNLLDEEGYVVATTSSAADGSYSFAGVFIGEYAVQAVDALGVRYSVLFVSAGGTFPELNVLYDLSVETSPDSRSAVSVDGVHDDLLQDFGYQRFLGSIGDTVYMDANQNGTQDLGEPGLGGVTVNLMTCGWTDSNDDGLFESGERTGCTTVAIATTTYDDPLTVADEGGKYLFANLPDLAEDTHYVVVVDTATLPGTVQTLTADPDTDGVACTLLPDPDLPDDEFPPPAVCDSEQLVPGFSAGLNYLGADFGYLISDPSYGLFGDVVWIDSNGDGLVDSGEPGIPYVTVWIDSNNDGVVDWTDGNANGVWDAGEGERWTRTDSNGYYLFTYVANGTYANVKVLASEVPAGLTQTFEVRAGNTPNDNVTVVIAGGVVTTLDGVACTDCDLSVDFGYRYAGVNSLSGTVCIDDSSANGYCAGPNTYSGVTSGESALGGMVVGLYLWTDSDLDTVAWDGSTGGLDPGDTFTLLGTTTTDANGDYAFSNVPDTVVVLLGVSEAQNLRLTTTNANSSVEDANVLTYQLYEGTASYEGHTVTVFARQALDLSGDTDNVIVDLDFALDGTLGGAIANDYGDLPESGTPDYDATLIASGGASHRIGAVYLGAAVTSETDGQPNADASGDTGDDGVSLLGNQLTAGPSGGTVNVTASAAGWLAGWIDFNGNGSFDDELERVVSAPVVAGAQSFSFDVPYTINGGVSGTGIPFFARFRIYPSQPLLESPSGQALTASFQPTTGEVEDYSWIVNVTSVVVSSFRAVERDGGVAIEWETSAESGTVGFYLRRWSRRAGRFVPLHRELLPAALDPQGGRYAYVDESAQPGIDYHYELVEVESSGRRNSYGPFQVNTSSAEALEPAEDAEGEGPELLRHGQERYGRMPRSWSHGAAGGRAAADRATFQADLARHRRGRRWQQVDGVKLGVSESGAYYVRLDDLASEGLPVHKSWLGSQRNLYGLTNGGSKVAFTASSDLQGIYFYGEAIESIFSRHNVYRLGASTGDSPRMRTRRERVSWAPTGGETFLRTVHAEENHFTATADFHDPERDFWLWDYVFAGWGAHSFHFRADGVAGGSQEATIRIRLKGGSDTPPNPDHRAVFRVNGSTIGEMSWNGVEAAEATLTFAADLLLDGENTLEIDGLKLSGVPYSLFYLDSFELRYPSYYRAYGDRLTCAADGNASILVGGFTGADIVVFDVSDPRLPVLVEARPWRLADGSYGVALAPPSPAAVYHVFTPDAALAPAWIERDTPSALRGSENRGEYLIVTTAPLAEAAQKLADHRSDLVSQVVDIEDVYDEFNYGIPSPHALRAFLAHARQSWETPPRYVVLAGDGDYDYEDALGLGMNLIPPMMVDTPNGLFASDVWFTGGDDAEDPGMTIGRLPATTASELEQMIAKIQLREGSAGAGWLQRMLFVADNSDKGGDFLAANAYLSTLAPAGSLVERIEVGPLYAAEARARLIAGIDQGTGSVSYVGHGGFDILADEGLLRSADVGQLQNTDRPTLFTAMTCVANNFAMPGSPSIGELLVRRGEGGAVGFWGPTGLSRNDLAVWLAAGYYSTFASDEQLRVGDAIRAATQSYRTTGWPDYMPSMYVLLGDPAMPAR